MIFEQPKNPSKKTSNCSAFRRNSVEFDEDKIDRIVSDVRDETFT